MLRQDPAILDRHDRALRKKRQHRVTGVAKEGRTTGTPSGQRVAIMQRPTVAIARVLQHSLHGCCEASEVRTQLVGAPLLRPAFLAPCVALDDTDKVHELAAAQVVCHSVASGPHPDGCAWRDKALEFRRRRHHETPGHIAREAWTFIAVQGLAHSRMNAVGPHEQITAGGHTSAEARLDAIAVLPERLERVPKVQRR